MLTIDGRTNKGYCDGVSRRSFLKIGAGIAGLGLTLPDLLRLEAAAAEAGKSVSGNKALINIYLGGGPPHTDMFDLKPQAPTEFRGEFNPIKTNVDGIEICELMPRLAKMADKYAVIRSIVGSYDSHSPFHTLTGYTESDLRGVGGRPSLGSVVARVQRDKANESKNKDGEKAPPYVSLMGQTTPGFLGPVYQPFTPDGQGRSNLTLSRIKADRLKNRTELLSTLDTLKRDIDASGAMDAMDSFTQRAV